MIIASYIKDGMKRIEINTTNQYLVKESLWIDLINPSEEEENIIEQSVGLNIPTREEMREIELSSRLYKQKDVLFMTAIMIAQSDSVNPKQDAVTFVITPKQLITIRYIEPQSFRLFISRLDKIHIDSSTSLLTDLLDTTIDRLADILEGISHRLERYSKDIFQSKSSHNTSYQQLLQQLGVNGELNAKIVESLMSFTRLIPYFDQSAIVKNDEHIRLLMLSKDITSLNDHATFLSNKISFLLEATLGMVQIEQNGIIKIFSVAAVIFLPPTLIASIYGMNFSFMPELSWKYGYILAIGLMLFSSWAPYKYFKYRKWL
ncbi:magnesium transport protein CorA [Legionella antarctica]|uniref:Magnesium transport protein CorA n=1 Tax=Legionella antarctica TaxID=2708020 RepID=A0A6F8T3Y4_9GAMM|nr:magnesium transporter CorA family protein [Legionella antarctica]BCA94676.1 magnesium transport protein CorA [Legionella antarctica]